MAALSPDIVPTDSPDRAVFVIDGKSGPVAAIDLLRMPDHISVEHLVAGASAGGALGASANGWLMR